MADVVRATQVFVENLTSKDAGDVRVTQSFVESLISKEPGNLRATEIFVEVLRSMAGADAGNLRATQVFFEVLRSRTDYVVPGAVYPGIPDVVATSTPTPAADAAIATQRWLVRTAHFDQLGEVAIEDFQIFVKRGIGGNADAPEIRFRANRDNKGFGKWIVRSLGKAGDRFSTVMIGPLGTAFVWQFEVACDDDCDVELQGMEAIFNRIGH